MSVQLRFSAQKSRPSMSSFVMLDSAATDVLHIWQSGNFLRNSSFASFGHVCKMNAAFRTFYAPGGAPDTRYCLSITCFFSFFSFSFSIIVSFYYACTRARVIYN